MAVNKQQLINRLAPQLGGRRAAALALDAVLDTIVRAVVAGDTVSVTGFGRFEASDRATRLARNPQTGERVQVPAYRAPAFRAGERFKDLVAQRRELPSTGNSIRKDPKGTYVSAPEKRDGSDAQVAA
ncbi:HU family DNA-binding protein [Kitasatospora purpeofusca]|uniref:HU family DNA-binding protein n=1 Tax=Kitasatospora purpeofusca TaxID=67352 RepID=UPI002E143EA9|nr:HU family DNA-binding protein [Kitasatospora purpeofusca]